MNATAIAVTPAPIVVSLTDTAKAIRHELQSHFSATKFSVRCCQRSATVHIRWSGCPTKAEVKALTQRYQGSTYSDRSECYIHQHYTDTDGQVYSYHANFIALHQTKSVSSPLPNADTVNQVLTAGYKRYTLHCLQVGSIDAITSYPQWKRDHAASFLEQEYAVSRPFTNFDAWFDHCFSLVQ